MTHYETLKKAFTESTDIPSQVLQVVDESGELLNIKARAVILNAGDDFELIVIPGKTCEGKVVYPVGVTFDTNVASAQLVTYHRAANSISLGIQQDPPWEAQSRNGRPGAKIVPADEEFEP